MKKFDFLFLTSTRFWAAVLTAISFYLETKGYIGEPERNLIATITSIFIGVRTIDRTVDVIAEGKGAVTTVSMPSTVSTVTATTDRD